MPADRLDRLKQEFPDCTLAALANLSAELVLRTDSAAAHPRETLDAICVQSAQTLGLPDSGAGDDPSPQAIVATAKETRVLLRDTEDPDTALICICAPGINVARFLPQARLCLQDILRPGTPS